MKLIDNIQVNLPKIFSGSFSVSVLERLDLFPEATTLYSLDLPNNIGDFDFQVKAIDGVETKQGRVSFKDKSSLNFKFCVYQIFSDSIGQKMIDIYNKQVNEG